MPRNPAVQLHRWDADLRDQLSDIVWHAVFAHLDGQPEWTGATAGEIAGRMTRAAVAAAVDQLRLDGGPSELSRVAAEFHQCDRTDGPRYLSIVGELTDAICDALPTD